MLKSIEKEVIELLIEKLNLKDGDITLDSKLEDELGADSLDLMEVIMSIEEKFGVEITDADAQEFRTVRDVVNFIEKF